MVTSVFKNIIIFLRLWIKLIILLLIGAAIIGFFVFTVYRPMYAVTLDGEAIGYTENKKQLQNKIDEYVTSGDKDKIAFVDIDILPEYDMRLIKKGLEANDEEIFEKVISSGTSYYKYYAILENSQEKYYVETYEEADQIVNSLKEKNSDNKDDVSYVVKYETELKEFTGVEATVAGLYKEKVIVKPNKKVNTAKTMDYTETALGISLIQPVTGTITSRFGRRSGGKHTGLDIANSTGTPIKAVADGVVTYAGYKGSYGRLVVIQHTNSVETYYAHCSRIYVSTGQQVNQGDVIAGVGSTGNSTGPHLHLEIRVNGVAKNPQYYLYK